MQGLIGGSPGGRGGCLAALNKGQRDPCLGTELVALNIFEARRTPSCNDVINLKLNMAFVSEAEFSARGCLFQDLVSHAVWGKSAVNASYRKAFGVLEFPF